MDIQQAHEIGKSIAQLWPATTPQQLAITVSSLEKEEFQFDLIAQALKDLYLKNSRFFLLSELRAILLGTKIDQTIDERIRLRRQQHELWEANQPNWAEAQKMWDSFNDAEREALWLEFIETQTELRAFFISSRSRGRTPKLLLAYVYEQAKGAKLQ